MQYNTACMHWCLYYSFEAGCSTLFSDEFNLDDPQWADINIVTGCLKLYLRELPDPLIPFKQFRSFIDAARKSTINFAKSSPGDCCGCGTVYNTAWAVQSHICFSNISTLVNNVFVVIAHSVKHANLKPPLIFLYTLLNFISGTQRIQLISERVNELPKPNYFTLKALAQHLRK